MFASAVEAMRSLASHTQRHETCDAAAQNADATAPLACPICDSAMKVCETQMLESRSESTFCLHALRCETCGMIADRLYHPVTGYEPGVPV